MSKTGKTLSSQGLFFCSYCNQEVERRLSHRKINKSCGCVRNKLSGKSQFQHGEGDTKLYVVWKNMKGRCLNPTNRQFKNYGGRGITICNKWLKYIPFRNWALANGYKEGLLMDRINNDSDYKPDNIRFTNYFISNRNRRGIKLNFEIAQLIRNLVKKNIQQKDLALYFGVCPMTINRVVYNQIWCKASEEG